MPFLHCFREITGRNKKKLKIEVLALIGAETQTILDSTELKAETPNKARIFLGNFLTVLQNCSLDIKLYLSLCLINTNSLVLLFGSDTQTNLLTQLFRTWHNECVWFSLKWYLLHCASSEPSAQSLFWSHIHASGMHSPNELLQVNSSEVQIFASEIRKMEKCQWWSHQM